MSRVSELCRRNRLEYSIENDPVQGKQHLLRKGKELGNGSLNDVKSKGIQRGGVLVVLADPFRRK